MFKVIGDLKRDFLAEMSAEVSDSETHFGLTHG